jgi:hypothetical protein
MTVLNKYHYGGVCPPGAVNIMRGTPFGNRFEIGKHGTRAEVVEQFRQELWRLLKHDVTWQDAVLALYGKDLFCCCAPLECHGDVLERAAEWLHNQRTKEPT